MSSIPTGFRFCPIDGELIVHYLQRKIKNHQCAYDQIVKEVDFYKYEDPVELIANNQSMEDQKEWYFYTRVKKVSKHRGGGSNIERTTPKGFWKASNSKMITYQGVEVGSRMNLVFYYNADGSKKGKGQKTNWLMNEFKLGTSKKSGGENEWVLCKVYNNKDNIDTINAQPVPSMVEHQAGGVLESGSEAKETSDVDELQNPNLGATFEELFGYSSIFM